MVYDFCNTQEAQNHIKKRGRASGYNAYKFGNRLGGVQESNSLMDCPLNMWIG